MTSTPEIRDAVADWHTPRLDRTFADEDCGCPHEEWVLCGITLDIHFEADGSIEVFADTGDWDHSFSLKADNMDAAREEAFAWVRSLPTEEELAA